MNCGSRVERPDFLVSLPALILCVAMMGSTLAGVCRRVVGADTWNHHDPLAITGRVTDVTGKPLRDVVVQLMWSRHPVGTAFMVNGLSTYPRRQYRHEVARDVTQEDGSFRIQVPWYLSAVEPRCLLLLSKSGFGSRCMEAFPSPESRPATTVLEREDRVSGKIIDECDKPLRGVRVSVIYSGIEAAHGFSGDDGFFEVRGIRRSESKAIYAARSSCDLGAFHSLQSGHADSAMTIRVPHGYSKTVRVRDLRGRPLSNAQVGITDQGDSAGGVRWTELLTDEDGCVSVTGLRSESVFVSCGNSIVRLGGDPECVAEVGSVCCVPLRVIDDRTGIGLTDALVYSAEYPGNCFFFGSDSWSSGNRVTFIVGRWTLCFLAEGYEPWYGRVVVDKATRAIEVRLKR